MNTLTIYLGIFIFYFSKYRIVPKIVLGKYFLKVRIRREKRLRGRGVISVFAGAEQTNDWSDG